MPGGLLDYVGAEPASSGVLVLLAVLLRVLTGLSGYSGAGDPPKYGDYEAQRHWMELTVNLPVREWYTDSAANNASYWPLDYPPLSGYQSWLCGLALRAVEPAAVALHTSRGYESPASKTAMRMTVVAADLLVYIPAALAAVAVFYPLPPASASPAAAATARRARALALFALLFNPALLLTDHGHFQYNGISLGFALGAAAAIGAGRRLLGSVLFCLALSHKQMSLFYAPAFFAHLLGWALHDAAHRSVGAKALAVAKLGAAVILTFAVCWAPWLASKGSLLQVLARIFPVRRGLYEDYLANWWCATSLVIKWKAWFAAPTLLRACALCTLAAAAPSMAHQIAGRGGARGKAAGAAGGPTGWGLLRCMAVSAFSFFMFGYQVHEKSILLPLLPITLLAGREPTLAAWMPLLAAFSMFPLLVRDGVALPYVALCALYGTLAAGTALEHAEALQAEQEHAAAGKDGGLLRRRVLGITRLALRSWRFLSAAAMLVAVGLHAARMVLPAPAHLPWLYDRAFITYAFAWFAGCYLYLQASQWLERSDGRRSKAD